MHAYAVRPDNVALQVFWSFGFDKFAFGGDYWEQNIGGVHPMCMPLIYNLSDDEFSLQQNYLGGSVSLYHLKQPV